MTVSAGEMPGPATSRPLRVAVVGAGPAGLYTADSLTFESETDVQVDLIERLPAPFGLLRYGVAPDHPTIKSAADSLQEVMERPNVSLFCNVEVGSAVTVDDLRAAYDAVVYAMGADADRALGIEGEGRAGSESATSFVKWYNGHPEAREFDLTGTRHAVVIGAGNVALDVTRMLVKDACSLRETDVPEHVLHALSTSSITDVHLIARRGPEHAKFSTKPLHELGELPGVDVIVDPAAIPAEPPEGCGPIAKRNLAIFRTWAERPSTGATRRLHLHFGTRPEAILGEAAVERLRVRSGDDVVREIPAELVLRAVGYRSRPIPGVPFADDTATIPHIGHRVVRDGRPALGEYAVGWAKRGPRGILGTNRADADDTAQALLADRHELVAARPAAPTGIEPVLADRGVRYLDLAAWNTIVDNEVRLGGRHGRPRVKIHVWGELVPFVPDVVGVP